MKKLLKIFIIVVILGAIAYGVKTFFFSESAENAAGPLVSAKVTQTTIATTISATGTLKPVDQVEVGTQVSGDIAKIFVDFNSKVKKGQVIAELDKSKLKATLTQAEIAYRSAETDYKYKESTYNRVKKLSESNSASAVELETAEYNMNSAALAVERSKNEVAQARLNLSYATIKSPINGIVLSRNVEVGQTVAASMSTPTLFIIAKDLSQMKVMADIDEADIGQVKQGQRVTFTVDAFQNETFNGSVQEVRLNPTTASNVVTYTVVITAENPDQKLLPGMTATCTIVTQEIKDAIAIPVKALKFTPADGTPMADPKGIQAPPAGMDPPSGVPGKFGPPKSFKKRADGKKPSGSLVWININGKAAPRHVKTGISDGVNIQILKGLDAGDSVVVSQESTKAKAEKSETCSPFMPGPPGKRKK
ncbi:efflux RND transporter periplasmic adaptor subunit [uncultured Fibrobacter sp.]|uniref:efflux RND transporter periplasmic adaptor subunit n=1 Tax=uncultured Fibrobacter sp. TaxID=261512 RepID=UPI00262BA258|nr:efflux RND transporter periplasmic adaptor subunit [uncultured Fibrobacter sp.]